MNLTLNEQAQCLLEWQTEAQDIRRAGQCPDCKGDSLLFYTIPSIERTVRVLLFNSVEIARDAIGGYFFCTNCRLCGSGFVKRIEYRRMEVYYVDELG